jgi:hypothetical protein
LLHVFDAVSAQFYKLTVLRHRFGKKVRIFKYIQNAVRQIIGV